MKSVTPWSAEKRARAILACAALALGVLGGAFSACTHADDAANNSPDGAHEAMGPDPCDVDAFFASGGNGGACFPVSTMACFAECTTGGCTCVRNPAGGDHGLWKCVVDLSCVPEGGPFDDAGNDVSAPVDADVDAGFDADDAG